MATEDQYTSVNHERSMMLSRTFRAGLAVVGAATIWTGVHSLDIASDYNSRATPAYADAHNWVEPECYPAVNGGGLECAVPEPPGNLLAESNRKKADLHRRGGYALIGIGSFSLFVNSAIHSVELGRKRLIRKLHHRVDAIQMQNQAAADAGSISQSAAWLTRISLDRVKELDTDEAPSDGQTSHGF